MVDRESCDSRSARSDCATAKSFLASFESSSQDGDASRGNESRVLDPCENQGRIGQSGKERVRSFCNSASRPPFSARPSSIADPAGDD